MIFTQTGGLFNGIDWIRHVHLLARATFVSNKAYMYSKSPFQVGVETVCTPSLLSRLRSGGAETETQ
ncbi:hypothetical protein F2Q68_00002119 [Brassica cretica]|uniref:Uncharacterized protein n=1 Tax=Brassica cretica TaxID=69181 RepID=A0A8S9JD40_BRACR|nr:hypothetical protein F2Q68_00002119 [Brassica cretica]